MSIENLAWVLPRPRKHKYKGGFPLHFEKKLLRLYGNPDKVLHPFGGHAECGVRCDVRPEVNPDYLCDAHAMPFEDESFDFVILDPPYSDLESKEIYGTGKLHPRKYVKEAVRVLKTGGYIAIYHKYMFPRPDGTQYDRRIFVGLRVSHTPRICCIFKKNG
jgi:SAM-dependent methyltransferase